MRFLWLLAALLAPVSAQAAVACQTNCASSTEVVNNSPTSPISDTSLTIASGANQVLLVTLVMGNQSTAPTTSMTWNGTSMTSISSIRDGGTSTWVQVFCLAAPTQGNHTLGITFSGTPSNVDYLGTVYTGANQTTPCQHGTTNTSTATTTLTLTITSATGDLVEGVFSETNTNPHITTGTQIFASSLGNNTNETAGFNTGASTVTVVATDTSASWAGVGVDIVAASGGTTPNFSTFFAPTAP